MDRVHLKQIVQYNCDIIDAQHAHDLPLCIYLLKMRDYFRWSKNLSLSNSLSKEILGDWIVKQEAYWESIETADLATLQLGQNAFDSFDVDEINKNINHDGLFYGAGFGVAGIPSFFLADLISQEQTGKHRLYITGQEHARGLLAMPAMIQNDTIIIRRDSLLRLLHEKVEEWQWHKHDNAMSRAMVYYDFDENYEESLQNMTNHALESVKLHELGELMASDFLGDSWKELLSGLEDQHLERILRAIKDHMADCLRTLPELIEKEDIFAIHFYMAGYEGYRKQLWPGLATAYKTFLGNNSLSALQDCVTKGLNHWLQIADNIVENYQQDKNKLLNLKQLKTLSLT